MISTKHTIARWFLIISVVLLIAEVSLPKQTQALFGAGDIVTDPVTNTETALTASATIYSKISAAYMELKETVLDPLAWMLAKQLLQSITADVVSWINSGFKGNPAFMSNPEAFFLDVADQTTGAFIANSGPLSSLCSPFSVDIRLALGLGAAQSNRKRYTCTLKTIINNVENIPNNITVNGKSINGFMNGDFSQGGWQAFISLTTEPQNNINGAYLMAQSDLQAQIGNKKASINADLAMGAGFMSYKKCTDLGTTRTDAEANDADTINQGDPTVSTRVNSDGSITYQSCHTETPGSVIASSLNKQLGTGSDSLVAADELNEILSAAFNQLIKGVLTGGLLSSSQQNSSGMTSSVVNSLRTDTAGVSVDTSAKEILDSINSYMSTTREYKSYRDQALVAILNMKSYFDSLIQLCKNDSYAGTIDFIEKGQIMPLLSEYQTKETEANTALQALTDIQTNISNTTDPQRINTLGQQFSSLLISKNIKTEIDVQNAKEDLNIVNATLTTIRNSISQYTTMCR
jgi:hypothetical protein